MERNLNALLILILSGVLFSAFGVQIFEHEEPCPLCLLQRLGMIMVAVGALCNIWFSPRNAHYGGMIISALFGGFVALRQISLHVCPGFPAFGLPVLGLSLYMWSFIVFVCSIAYIALLLVLFDGQGEAVKKKNGLHKLSFGAIFLAAFFNIFTTYLECGFGPCQG